MKQTSIQQRVQKEISHFTQKKRKELTDKERVRLLQLKLYQKAKQEKGYRYVCIGITTAKANEEPACMVSRHTIGW